MDRRRLSGFDDQLYKLAGVLRATRSLIHSSIAELATIEPAKDLDEDADLDLGGEVGLLRVAIESLKESRDRYRQRRAWEDKLSHRLETSEHGT